MHAASAWHRQMVQDAGSTYCSVKPHLPDRTQIEVVLSVKMVTRELKQKAVSGVCKQSPLTVLP